MIYADNAATTQLDIDAFEAMKPYLLEQYGNPSQQYSFSRTTKNALKEARITIAECIGAFPEEIYFTSGGTESDNWAIKGVCSDFKDEIVTSIIEHHAVLHACDSVRETGKIIKYLPVDSQGIVSLNELEASLCDRTALVSIMLVNNEIGTVEPIQEIAEIAHKHGALVHTDAVQAVGHMNIDVNNLCVDMLSASAHKFNGPRGIGFLYIRTGTEIRKLIDGGVQERSMRAGTENVAAIVAMAKALKKNCDSIDENRRKIYKIEDCFIDKLNKSAVEYVRNGAIDRIPGNISISIKGANGELLLHRLDLKGICVSTGSACDSVNNQVSHVIRAIKVPEAYAEGTIRISFGKDNTEEEAELIAEAIIEIVGKS